MMASIDMSEVHLTARQFREAGEAYLEATKKAGRPSTVVWTVDDEGGLATFTRDRKFKTALLRESCRGILPWKR